MDALNRDVCTAADAAKRIHEVQRGMMRLSALESVARLTAAAPVEACRCVGVRRAMLSHVDGDRIVFQSVSHEAEPLLGADFARLARAVRPRLERCAPEHQAVVRQRPVLVADTQTAEGLFRPLTHIARTRSYIVAPIVRQGVTVGLLHADNLQADQPLDELDRELLWTFATGVGWAMQDITTRVRQGAGGVPVLAGALEQASAAVAGPAGLVGAGQMPQRLAALTSRELEVLELLAEGASNAGIGKALIISEATVKSHVRNILRKVGAANRTEAVSIFLATRPNR